MPPQTYFNQPPPELGFDGRWINTDAPLTISSLQGNVIWIEFSCSHCGGCIAMKPQLARWHESYADEGFVIIDVHNGKADEQWHTDPLADLEKTLSEEPVPYPVLFDEHGTTCDRYGIPGYPWGFLIGRNGRVIWQDAPSGNQGRVEAKIRDALNFPERLDPPRP